MSPLTPGGSSDPAGPIDDGGGGLTGPGPSGFSGWLVNLAAPIAYLAMVLLVAFVIARRRLERRERAAALAGRTSAPDPDSLPVRRVERQAAPVTANDEENIPRWLRPSLRAERFGMDQPQARVMPAALQAAAPARTPLTFGGVADEASDRRVIRSAVAGLLDQPDASGRRVAELERGDEVEILETAELWANVLTPTGLAGWLPTVVLTDPTGEAAGSGLDAGLAAGLDAGLDPRLRDAAVDPTATDQPFDLVAYLAARQKTDSGTGSSGVG